MSTSSSVPPITQADIPLAMKLLGITTVKEFAEQLGITTRSLTSSPDEPMPAWRQMSVECLLRRARQWELFCHQRGLSMGNEPKEGLTGYRCIVCNQCIERLAN